MSRIAVQLAVAVANLLPAAYSGACVMRDVADDGSFTLKNDCPHAVNVKYTFSSSKPFSGTYTTLQPGARTAERAMPDEDYAFYECAWPAVPQTLKGGCVP